MELVLKNAMMKRPVTIHEWRLDLNMCPEAVRPTFQPLVLVVPADLGFSTLDVSRRLS